MELLLRARGESLGLPGHAAGATCYDLPALDAGLDYSASSRADLSEKSQSINPCPKARKRAITRDLAMNTALGEIPSSWETSSALKPSSVKR